MQQLEPIKGISGTLIGAIAELNPWKSPVSAYNAVFGLDEPDGEKQAATWGQRIEPLLARQYQDDTGAILWPNCDFGMDYKRPMHHQTHSWWSGTPDRLVIADPKWLIPVELYCDDYEQALHDIEVMLTLGDFWKSVRGGWEGKTAGYRMMGLWGEKGTDSIPEMYLVQSAWYLAMCRSWNPKITRWDLSCLIGGQDYRPYIIEHNAKLEESLARLGLDFWENHILARTPPPVSADPAWKQFFQRFYPTETEPMDQATDEDTKNFLELYDINLQLKPLEERQEILENTIKLALGEREGFEGTLADGKVWKVTWKKVKDRQVVNYEGAVADFMNQGTAKLCRFMQEIIDLNTKDKPGVRRMLSSWPKEPKPVKEKKTK